MTRCLAIDDDSLFLKMLAVFCNDMDDVELVGTYENPVEGVMACVKAKPDVLLLDLEMPYLSGFEALETLDKFPKIIVISGHLSANTDAQIPIDKFLSKADLMSSDTLHNAIKEVTAK
ncbi:LytR/AlgR family response regulator transcription factor [Marinoscillum furvescens]|uniref:Response regulator receiver domain-containing protein n=1 Tax=Marinoscillum furvescens DSM 4134 TaxID=1122208 RepID=A0A3D9LIU6_MARFU|nr:response regulator [Marinoscillum furvescens]REE05586.1 response regulator receiver domain-containing protein [Marinoscillum furvescens DSM 4134]